MNERPTKTIYNPVTETTYIIKSRVIKNRKKGYISGKWKPSTLKGSD